MTGKHASPSVKAQRPPSKGSRIRDSQEKMEGQLENNWTFKRKEQAVGLGAKVKMNNGTLIQMDHQNLFNRLIALDLVMSLENRTDLAGIMSHEKALFRQLF